MVTVDNKHHAAGEVFDNTSGLRIIDLSNFETRKHEIAGQLISSARDVGFFFVKGHGIPQSDIDKTFEYSKLFFDLPVSVKEKHPFDLDIFAGWRGLQELSEVTGTRLWEQFVAPIDRPGTPLAATKYPPDELIPGFKQHVEEFQRKSQAVAGQLLRGLAIGLGQPEDYFLGGLDFDADDAATLLGFNYYPPTEGLWKAGDAFRLHGHADYNLITLLYRRAGEPGLELLPGKEAMADPRVKNQDIRGAWRGVPDNTANWIPAPPLEGTITVNIADILTRWTDGELRSTYHRVRSPDQATGEPTGERRSLAHFVAPRRSFVVKSIKGTYPPITAGELIASEGHAYGSKFNDPEWQRIAYSTEGTTAAANAAKSQPGGASRSGVVKGVALMAAEGYTEYTALLQYHAGPSCTVIQP